MKTEIQLLRVELMNSFSRLTTGMARVSQLHTMMIVANYIPLHQNTPVFRVRQCGAAPSHYLLTSLQCDIMYALLCDTARGRDSHTLLSH